MSAKPTWLATLILGAIVPIVVAMIMASPTAAQSNPGAPSSSENATQSAKVVLMPGTLTGLGSMGPRGSRRFCSPRSVGLAEWRLATISRMISPSSVQQAALDDLAVASAGALDLMASACRRNGAATSPLAVMQMRIEMLLQVLQKVRPSYDAFYATLDQGQKMRLDALGPGRRGWQW